MPDDARSLIEGVYADAVQASIPAPLQSLSDTAEGVQRGDAAMGSFNCLNLGAGYTRGMAGQHSRWDDEVRIPTRLGQDTVVVALARLEGSRVVPYAAHPKPRAAWALSQLSLSQSEWNKAKDGIPSALASKIEQLKGDVADLRWVEVFPLVSVEQQVYESVAGWLGAEADRNRA